jgi:poly(A) polymerase
MTAPPPDAARPPSLFGAPWLARAETQAVLAAIAAGGFSARVVGGAVRNALMGLTVKDVDIATTATPDEVMALAAVAGLGTVPTGIAHGTVSVISAHVPYEVTTLRQDVETFGRHARVAFTEDWAADARRRDFTFNALYCDAAGDVLDPLGGYPDLVARRVRFIDDPVARIREDYLRILRFFRFHAEYGHGAPDAAGLAACIAERDGLRQLSAERVRAELLRLLAAPGARGAIVAMQRAGILVMVVQVSPDVETFERLVAVEHSLGHAGDAVLRLAALVRAEADTVALQQRLRLTGEETQRLLRLRTPILGLAAGMSEIAARAAIYRAGTGPFLDALLLAWASGGAGGDDAGWRRLHALASRWQPPVLPVRGADVLARGVLPGPAVGRILAEVETWWIAAGFPADRAMIERALDRAVVGSGP